ANSSEILEPARRSVNPVHLDAPPTMCYDSGLSTARLEVFRKDPLVTGPQPARFDASPARRCYPWILGILSLSIPFVFAPVLADPFELPKLVFLRLGALLVIAFGWWQLRSPGPLKLLRSQTTLPVLLLAFISLLSIFQSVNRPAATAAARDLVIMT